MKGFQTAWAHEAAFRQEVMLCAVLIPFALWLNVSVIERIALIGVLAIVIIVELINSAIEAAVDRIGPESHYLSGAAKDLGSAAVLVAITLTAFVWGSVLWDVLARTM
ncbi:diacylglycerol kinase [Aestuariicella sp. G3-2]|nr:diacylglycerol kinase [Aestuariicella albida]MBU3068514.1 diacylglycerol kinase [Aestuariicella albida]